MNGSESERILRWRVRELEGRLHMAQKDLERTHIDPQLRYAVGVPFGKELLRQLKELATLNNNLNTHQPIQSSWVEYESLRIKSQPLFAELLAFLHGALIRSSGLDNGLCAISDAMLRRLGSLSNVHWSRLTILADKEFLGSTAEIIRSSYPDASIWNLPVMAHEFGHFVGPEIKDPAGLRPFQRLLEPLTGEQASHAHEHFADIFATFALGPAYACTCLILRFSAPLASTHSKTHPSPMARAHLILKTLAEMDLADASKPYAGAIRWLREQWMAQVTAAGQARPLDESDLSKLDVLFADLWKIVSEEVPMVRYNGWQRALSLDSKFQSALTGAAMPAPEENLSIPDVLNAAWLLRRRAESARLGAVGEAAKQLCCEIAGAPPTTH